ADAGDRSVDRIIHISFCVDRKTAAQHGNVAGSSVNGEDQRVGLQGTNPYRVEALIEDPERSKKSASGDSDLGIRDVVDLRIVHVLIDRSTVRSASERALKLALEFR